MIDSYTYISVRENVVVKTKAYFQLLKFRLSFLVTFSGAIAFYLGSGESLNWSNLLVFCLGGFLVTGAANIINQVIEKDIDKLMTRTQNRPLPTSVLHKSEAIFFAAIIGSIGLFIHYQINFLTFAISLISLLLYGFAYTPLKRVGPIAVLVGAFPGAFPPLIGWVAATGEINLMAMILFGVQFLWQFPHFWAIAWVAHEDYTRAGFKLLPSSGGRDLSTAFNIMVYTLFLIPASIMPYMIGVTGRTSAIIVIIAGLLFLSQTFLLMKKCDRKSAMQMMFGSFIYLPIVQIAYVLDKI
jgi:heme o synthase